MKIYIETISGGFSIMKDGHKTKWSFSIESMVPVKKRTKLEDYYLLLKTGDKNIDRVFIPSKGDIKWINESASLPKYAVELAEDIITTGDLNKYLKDKVIENKFTMIGMARE